MECSNCTCESCARDEDSVSLAQVRFAAKAKMGAGNGGAPERNHDAEVVEATCPCAGALTVV